MARTKRTGINFFYEVYYFIKKKNISEIFHQISINKHGISECVVSARKNIYFVFEIITEGHFHLKT